MMELQAINAINSFYNDAFNHLIAYTTFLITIIGVIVPLVIARAHTKKLEEDKLNLENKINEKIGIAIEKLSIEIEGLFRPHLDNLKDQIELNINQKTLSLELKTDVAEGCFWHNMAALHNESGRFDLAITNACGAIGLAFKGQNETGIVQCNEIIEKAFNGLNFDRDKNSLIKIKNSLESLKSNYDKNKSNGRYNIYHDQTESKLRIIKSKIKDYNLE